MFNASSTVAWNGAAWNIESSMFWLGNFCLGDKRLFSITFTRMWRHKYWIWSVAVILPKSRSCDVVPHNNYDKLIKQSLSNNSRIFARNVFCLHIFLCLCFSVFYAIFSPICSLFLLSHICKYRKKIFYREMGKLKRKRWMNLYRPWINVLWGKFVSFGILNCHVDIETIYSRAISVSFHWVFAVWIQLNKIMKLWIELKIFRIYKLLGHL